MRAMPRGEVFLAQIVDTRPLARSPELNANYQKFEISSLSLE